MPSDRKQVNIRMDEEGLSRLGRLVITMRSALGLSSLSQSDVIMAGLVELEKRYPSAEPKKKGTK